jgi:hypothetical protein
MIERVAGEQKLRLKLFGPNEIRKVCQSKGIDFLGT